MEPGFLRTLKPGQECKGLPQRPRAKHTGRGNLFKPLQKVLVVQTPLWRHHKLPQQLFLLGLV
jgi:hypothetical protein